MKLHHLALGARDVAALARFYTAAFELFEVARHHYDDGRLRSIWLRFSEGPVLMIEETSLTRPHQEGVDGGFFLLAMAIEEGERSALEDRLLRLGAPIEDRSSYSSYARDPEGNRIALSFYPLP